MNATDKLFGTFCLKASRNTFFPKCYLRSGEGWWDLIFWWGMISNKRGKFKLLSWLGEPFQKIEIRGISPLVGHPDLPIKKTLRVLGLHTAMVLKRVSESIFFQCNNFTACKVKDGNEVANSLMIINLLKIIHPFQGKKHLKA